MRATAALLMGSVLLAGCLAACSAGNAASPAPATTAATPAPGTPVLEPETSGDQPEAITYDTQRVPLGTHLATTATVANGRTTVTLTVTGLPPRTAYGAHVHTKVCGAKPADAGPHYQNEKDPVSPSVDPTYANPDNEIWLDLTTDDKGSATSSATVHWQFRKGDANAIVLHATHTHTEPGKAGTAGDRLACLTHAF